MKFAAKFTGIELMVDVKDIKSLTLFQRKADKLIELKRSIAQYRAGRVRGMEEALSDLETRHLVPAKRRRARSAK
jgi:hypothetical protein